jgi:hypothetical protein
MLLSASLSLSVLFLLVIPMTTVVVMVEAFVLQPSTTQTNNNIFLRDSRTPPFFTSEKSTAKEEIRKEEIVVVEEKLELASSASSSTAGESADESKTILQQIDEAKKILYRAAETKKEDPDIVVDALLTLEKLSRKANQADPSRAEQTLSALSGEGGVNWRLIFTTGTIDTQKKLGTKVNYFPLKATQSFDSSPSGQEDGNPWLITNGIYLGDEFALVKFEGDFDWTLTPKSGLTKVTFDFSRIQLFNGLLDIPLKKGEAASLGAKSGLGSEGNIKLNEKGKRAFFNWISADEKIATARGGGGGIALWKRIS